MLFRDGEGRAFGLTMSDLAKGVYLTGAPRSGKTTVLYHLLSQLIPRLGPHDGLIIFDPRGDLRRQFFRPGDIVLDPNPHGHGNAAWSLFADLLAFGSTDYDLDQSAARIVTRLFADNQNQLTPFFTIAPRRLLENLLLVYARTILAHPETAGQYRNETLLKYCANLSREKIRELIRCAPAPGELRSYLGNCASDQALGVLGELQASVSALRGFAGGSSPVFSVVDFARDGGGKLLFLEFDASAADTQGPIFGLIEDLAYLGMDFRRDLGKPFQPPYQVSVSRYTDNYIIMMSASKIFSYAGQRIAVIAISDKIYSRYYEDLMKRYGLGRFGQVMVQRILYCLSSGTSHTAQYAIAAMLKAASDGTLDFVEEVKEYGRRTAKLKEIFQRNGFHIVYDHDLDEPLSDGFFFTVGYKDVEGGELLRQLMHYGVSAIVLSTTGSDQQGLRICASTVQPRHYDMLDRRLRLFNENYGK